MSLSLQEFNDLLCSRLLLAVGNCLSRKLIRLCRKGERILQREKHETLLCPRTSMSNKHTKIASKSFLFFLFKVQHHFALQKCFGCVCGGDAGHSNNGRNKP